MLWLCEVLREKGWNYIVVTSGINCVLSGFTSLETLFRAVAPGGGVVPGPGRVSVLEGFESA
jgi:hypothetical protein